jgi:protein required for attachment to host cells
MKITGKAVSNNFQIEDKPRYFYGKRIPRTWIMVIDRKKAHVFYKASSGLELIADALPDFKEKGHDLTNSSGVEAPEGPQKYEVTHFARNLTAWLEEAHKRDAFDELVLVAAPRMLGQVREHLPTGLRKQIIGEISKDLTNLSIPDIQRHLSNVIYFRE